MLFLLLLAKMLLMCFLEENMWRKVQVLFLLTRFSITAFIARFAVNVLSTPCFTKRNFLLFLSGRVDSAAISSLGYPICLVYAAASRISASGIDLCLCTFAMNHVCPSFLFCAALAQFVCELVLLLVNYCSFLHLFCLLLLINRFYYQMLSRLSTRALSTSGAACR